MSDEPKTDRRSARANNSRAQRQNARPDGTLPARFVPQFWKHADARLVIVREIRERYEALKADAGAVSVQQDLLCQRATFLSVWLETQERQAVEDGAFSPGPYAQGCCALIGLLKALGLGKHRKTVASLRSYVDGKAGAG